MKTSYWLNRMIKYKCFELFKKTVDAIDWNRSGGEFQALNDMVRSQKIVCSLGRMYHEVEAERRHVRSMVSNEFKELHSITDVRRTVASVDEMHQQTQLKLNPWLSWKPMQLTYRPSEMLSRGRRFNTIRAAAFWTRWRAALVDVGNPASMPLQ